eukprot:1381209-Rhodomonas_salina.1
MVALNARAFLGTTPFRVAIPWEVVRMETNARMGRAIVTRMRTARTRLVDSFARAIRDTLVMACLARRMTSAI